MQKIVGQSHDLGGGMLVRRVLPQVARRTVGPFVFLDHMGPLITEPLQNTDVRPHPHIGLSTLTYLFEGKIVHRDSLGSIAAIQPGEVNWMTAGRGISHSERADDEDRGHARKIHGLQCWIALPLKDEDCEPSFQHYSRHEIPETSNEQYKIILAAGEGFGLESPVKISSDLIFSEILASQNCKLNFKKNGFELALYVIEGQARFENQEVNAFEMLIFEKDQFENLQLQKGSRVVLLGGAPLDGPRHIWWNLVSSSKEKIEIAKKQWLDGTFPMVPGETEFIPLPER